MYPAPLKGSGTRISGGDGHYLAYGLESCLALARRDLYYNTNKAEDNADSWSIYFMLRMIVLAYPELDIMEAYRTPDLFAARDRRVRQREYLLHHCTLFQVLRHPDAGNIWDLPDYDPSKDTWGPDTGRERPQTTTELVEILKIWDQHYNQK